MTFGEWWNDGIAKPVDIGFDCAQAAWDFQEKRLAEIQAREKALRDAMKEYFEQYPHMLKGYVWDALDIPTDDTALKSLLKAERERCAKIADANARIDLQEHGETTYFGDIRADEAKGIAKQIRALGD